MMDSLNTGASTIHGDITTAALNARLAGTAGTGEVTLTGTIDNSAPGSVLELRAGTPLTTVNLNGGTVRGGTLRLTSGAMRFNTDSAFDLVGTLDGLRVLGDLAVANGSNPFPRYNSVLGLRNGITFAGLSGTGRGSLTLGAGAELRALDAETLDHVDLRFGAPNSFHSEQLLTTAAGTTLTLAADTAVNVLGAVAVGGGGTLNYAGAVMVQAGGSLAVASGTTLARASSGSLDVAVGGTLAVAWAGTAAPLAGVAGAVVDGTLALTGSLTSAAYRAALDGVTGAGGVSVGGTLDNTGAALALPGTVAGRLTVLGTLKGGTVAAGSGALTLGSTATLDGVSFLGPAILVGNNPSPSLESPLGLSFFRDGLALLGANGSGPGALTLRNLSLRAADTELLDNASLRLTNATLSGATGSRLTLGAGLALDVTGNSTLANTTSQGSITVEGGSTLNVDGSVVNSGVLSLKFNSTLSLSGTTTAGLSAGTIAFKDTMARLVFQGTGAVGATLQNFQNGDSIDLQGLSYSASFSVGLQGGAVQLSQGSTLVGNFQLSGGAYSADQFSLAANGHGGTLLRTTHRLSAPVLTGPGRDFDPAYYLAQYPDIAATGIDPLQHYLSYGWHEGRNPNAYFNTNYYLNQNPDIAALGLNPLQHFEDYGWKENRDPGPGFSTSGYLAANPDVRAAGIDPLQHFLANGRAEGRSAVAAIPHAVGAQDPLMDRTWYLAQHPDVAASGEDASANYHRVGWTLGYNPDQWFDTTYYLKAYGDVAAAQIDPLAHFEASGYQEGREPSLAFSDSRYLANNPDVAAAHLNPLLHYMAHGQFEGRMAFINGPQGGGTPDPLVDRAFYYAQFATIVPAAADAAASYDQAGWRQGLNPDALFDTQYYLSRNADIRAAGINPLQHYEAFGWKEGRDPSPAFSTNKYLAAYSDVRGSGTDPLTSFVTTGQAQGRTAFAV